MIGTTRIGTTRIGTTRIGTTRIGTTRMVRPSAEPPRGTPATATGAGRDPQASGSSTGTQWCGSPSPGHDLFVLPADRVAGLIGSGARVGGVAAEVVLAGDLRWSRGAGRGADPDSVVTRLRLRLADGGRLTVLHHGTRALDVIECCDLGEMVWVPGASILLVPVVVGGGATGHSSGPSVDPPGWHALDVVDAALPWHPCPTRHRSPA